MLWVHLQTIFSFRSYHLLAFTSLRQRVGFAAYLLLLSMVVFYFFSSAYIGKNLPIFLKNFPDVTFESGTLTAPQTAVSAPLPRSDFKIVFDASRNVPPTVNEMIENNTLMFVTQKTLYMPASTGVQSRPLPKELTAHTTPEWLEQNEAMLAASLRFIAFIFSLFLIPLILLFDFCIASAVGLFFNLLRPYRLSRRRILTWAFFMLGPLTVLWFVRLWVTIPLFTLAQFILCIIYMQQIFNTFPEGN